MLGTIFRKAQNKIQDPAKLERHLKENVLRGNDIKRRESKKNERWKSFKYDELIASDKANLDIFWLKDDSLEYTENLPAPGVLAGNGNSK